jgi:hypothetical protein
MQFSSHLFGAFVYGTHLYKNKLFIRAIVQQITKTRKEKKKKE